MKLWFEKGAWASTKAHTIAKELSPQSVRSIAIIRHAAIGDMMVLRPFLLQARTFFPNATITLSIVNNYRYGTPVDLVDRVHIVHKKKGDKKTSFAARWGDIRALGAHDIVFDMADTALSGLLTLVTLSKLKLGFPYRTIKNHLFYDIGIHRSDLVPEVETLLQMLYILGAPKFDTIDYGYPLYCTKKVQPYIVYFTSASLGWKWWPTEHFKVLIAQMAAQYPQYDHIILEGIHPEEKVDGLMKSLSGFTNVHKQAPLPLETIIPFLGESTLVVSGDTGIRNMAIAAQAPTLGIFFFTVPYRYLPIDPRHRAVFNPEGSVPCVEEVALVLKEMIEG